MKKVIGYAISIVGLAIMATGFGIISVGWKILKTVKPNYTVGVGIIIIAVGIFISLQSKNRKNRKREIDRGEKEVPIYEGAGKNRKVVGYRKD